MSPGEAVRPAGPAEDLIGHSVGQSPHSLSSLRLPAGYMYRPQEPLAPTALPPHSAGDFMVMDMGGKSAGLGV